MRRISWIVLAGLGLFASTAAANAQSGDIQAVDPAPFHKLSCDEIASRIQALNIPIGSANNSWDELRRNPTLQFILLGIKKPNPTYEEFLARARGERIALIQVAVDKNCAAQRGLQ